MLLGCSAFFVCIVFLIFNANLNANTQTNLDKLYAKGFYLSQHNQHTQAFTIMQNLANKNYPPAVQNIALSYYHGLGVAKDLKKAQHYFTKAHNLGILDATNELANIYYASKNIEKAVKLWQYGSDSGDGYATYNLATYYLEMHNISKAQKLLLKAQELGHPYAQKLLQQLHM